MDVNKKSEKNKRNRDSPETNAESSQPRQAQRMRTEEPESSGWWQYDLGEAAEGLRQYDSEEDVKGDTDDEVMVSGLEPSDDEDQRASDRLSPMNSLGLRLASDLTDDQTPNYYEGTDEENVFPFADQGDGLEGEDEYRKDETHGVPKAYRKGVAQGSESEEGEEIEAGANEGEEVQDRDGDKEYGKDNDEDYNGDQDEDDGDGGNEQTEDRERREGSYSSGDNYNGLRGVYGFFDFETDEFTLLSEIVWCHFSSMVSTRAQCDLFSNP
ncbi:hypothetical protein K458DRAFT_403447 [Lentithecium fluviatile CBS 122367]|uniref:Uncharacterized protein n=1 Tax=Lentithecium fluviatile CBS 122367 TaxID=1168545 RepID=A0A6G1J3W9_9PLEO|nr:hypothetical protein K458DRAFT_403447 [Lentithecium fluviatile CBS 122367]